MMKRIWLALSLAIIASTAAMSQSVKLRTYYNKQFKIGFKYPASWSIDRSTGSVPDDPAWTYFASISLRGNANREELQGASATILIARITKSACNTFKPTDGGELNKPIRTKVGKFTFFKVSITNSGAGISESVDTYRTFHGGQCYEISNSVRQQTGRKPDQNVELAAKGLDTILRTFYFGK